MRFISLLIVCALAAPKNPATQCGPGSHWVRAHHRRGYIKGDGTVVKETDVRAHCQTNPKGYAEWEPKLLNGKPKYWGPTTDQPGEWTVEERERALEALSEIPDFLKNELDNIYRMKNLNHPENPASTRGANTIVYDAAFDSNQKLAQILAHEMAHRYLEGLSDADKNSFRKAAKWLGSSGLQPGRPKGQFLRPNGMLSYHEDFADDMATYILDPNALKSVSPEIFGWMEKHVGPKLR